MIRPVEYGFAPVLARLAMLTGLEGDDLAAVERLCRDVRTVRPRATLVSQGKAADRLYVLLDGWMCTYRLLADGRRQITTLALPGDICNLEALQLRHSGNAIGTLTPCKVAAIQPQAMQEVMTERPAVRRALAWLQALDNAMLAERNACLGRRSAREHVAHLICELLIRLTIVGRTRGNGFTFPLTQEEIADVLGLTSVHVNRVVQGLRREELIDYSGKELVVRQWSQLRATAGFRADYLHLEGLHGTGTDFSAAPWAHQASAPRVPVSAAAG